MASLLDQLYSELQALKGGQQLGFGHHQRPRYVYCNRSKGDCCWYFWNHDNNSHEPIVEGDLTGYIEKVVIHSDKQFKGKQSPKLRISVKADQKYVLEAGMDTQFAKGAISGLSQVTDFSKPVTFFAEAGDTDTVLFCRIMQSGEALLSKYDDHTDFDSMLSNIQQRLGSSPTQTSTPMEETYEYTFDEDDLTGETAEVAPKAIDRNALMDSARATIGRLKWSKPDIAAFIGSLFPGKSKTSDLSDQQMADFVDALLRAESGSTVSIVDTIAEPLQPKHSAAIKAASSIEELKRILKNIHGDRAILTSPIADQLSATANAKIAQISKAQQEAMAEKIPF